MNHLRCVPLLGLALVASAAEPVPPPIPAPGAGPLGACCLRLPGAAFTSDPLWDDGLAEVCTYDLVQHRYGQLHTGGSITTIVVREFMDPERTVKAAGAVKDAIPVLKCHLVRSYQTGVYRYEQAATTFLRRDDAVPLRLFWVSHEWCGGAAKTWVNRGAGSRLRTMSYFDGHGDVEQDCTPGDQAVFEDQAWVWLRTLLDLPATPQRLELVPTQLDARVQPVAGVGMSIAITPLAQPLATVLGPLPAIEVVLSPEKSDEWLPLRYTYEAAKPHRLLAYQHWDGTTWKLATARRFDYWLHHDVGDAPSPVR